MNSCHPNLLSSLVRMFVFLKYIFIYFFTYWALVLVAAYYVLCYSVKLLNPAVHELLDNIEWNPVTRVAIFHHLIYIMEQRTLRGEEGSYPFVRSP